MRTFTIDASLTTTETSTTLEAPAIKLVVENTSPDNEIKIGVNATTVNNNEAFVVRPGQVKVFLCNSASSLFHVSVGGNARAIIDYDVV